MHEAVDIHKSHAETWGGKTLSVVQTWVAKEVMQVPFSLLEGWNEAMLKQCALKASFGGWSDFTASKSSDRRYHDAYEPMRVK
jgi:hypothetical protein